MHTGKQKQMNVSYQASLVNRHIRRFTGNISVGGFITSEDEGRASLRWIWEFSQVERPTDRPTDRPWRFSASYIFWTKLPIDKRFSASESHIQ